MRQNFINELYYGRFCALERQTAANPEHTAIVEKINEERQYFSSKLSYDDGKRFRDLEDLVGQSGAGGEISAFAYGLRLGALWMDFVLAQGEDEPQADE